MARPGAPSKIADPHPDYPDMTVGEGIVHDISRGIFKTYAAEIAGVTRMTVHNWLTRGEVALDELRAVETEHPGALNCEHRWRNKTCTRCGIARPRWEALPPEYDYAEFFYACARGRAKSIGAILAALHDRVNPIAPQPLRDEDGAVVYHKNGKPVWVVPEPGDWRAGLAWAERVDPKRLHLTAAAVVDDDEPQVERVSVVDQFHDDLDALYAKMEAADTQRAKAEGLQPADA